GEAVAEAAEQLVASDLEEPEVAGVVHDPHRVAVGEEHAVARHRSEREDHRSRHDAAATRHAPGTPGAGGRRNRTTLPSSVYDTGMPAAVTASATPRSPLGRRR